MSRQALIDHLLEHSVRRGDFVLKSGKRSSWFIDAKQTTCRPDGMLLVADAALDALPDDITAIGGLTMGADAVAFSIAAIAATRGRNLRSFSVRKEVKDHGGGGRIAGALEPGDRVAITEDAVTRGVSMLEAAEVVREVGAEPVLLLPVVDRGGTVATMAAEHGLPLRALVTAPDLGFLMRKEVVETRKLSRAAIETLAIVAYHQPVTRAEIEEIRGVSVSRGTVDQLIEMEWIRFGRRKMTPGRPVTFVVTQEFLDHFGLESARDLPGLKELRSAGLLESRPPPGLGPQLTEPEDEDDAIEGQSELFED